jgi:outer membrane protein
MYEMNRTTARKCLASAVLLFAPVVASAADKDWTEGSADRWSLGVGVASRTKVYTGEKAQTMPFPIVNYEGDRFYLRGIGGGFHVINGDHIVVNATVAGNFFGFKTKDLNKKKLAEEGLTRGQLKDRKYSVDTGGEFIVKGSLGQVTLTAKSDVGNASKGIEANFDYRYFWQLGDRLTIVPSAGVAWLNDKRANYYYGTLKQEVARGVTSYQPGALLIPQASLSAVYAINEHWKLTGFVSQNFLPDKATKGPLIKKDVTSMTSVFVGVSRGF